MGAEWWGQDGLSDRMGCPRVSTKFLPGRSLAAGQQYFRRRWRVLAEEPSQVCRVSLRWRPIVAERGPTLCRSAEQDGTQQSCPEVFFLWWLVWPRFAISFIVYYFRQVIYL